MLFRILSILTILLIGQFPTANRQVELSYTITLPAIFRQLPLPSEVEPNNTRAQANGPIEYGVSYFGIQDDIEDRFDVFYFKASSTQTVRIMLSNPPSNNIQLQLHTPSTVLPLRYVYQAPFVIDYPITENFIYYVSICFPPETPPSQIYDLKVFVP